MAGAGGQGIMFLGKSLAHAGMLEGRNVTWFPSYGAEMRGGTANCTLILSDNMIGSPVIMQTDILIAMNSSSIERFQPKLKSEGLLLFDSSLMNGVVLKDDIRPVGIPAKKIAASAGDVKAANIVMLGGLIASTDILKKSTFDRLFSFSHVPERNKAAVVNKNALREGIKYLENKKSSNF